MRQRRHDKPSARAGRAWIGTSGWVYAHWKGRFYPPEVHDAERLAFYASRFSTVEVNYTFYRLPERPVFEGWRRDTPDGFRFAVKASRFLTHIKRLRDPEEPLARLIKRADGLGKKLGPILFQLPPNFPLDAERFDVFLRALAAYPERQFTVEFRHPSWLTEPVFEMLEHAGVALCIPYAPGLAREERLTAPFAYFRMHHGASGVGFGDEELDECAGSCRAAMAKGADVYVYFNNDAEAHAIEDAFRLRERLAGGAHWPPWQGSGDPVSI